MSHGTTGASGSGTVSIPLPPSVRPGALSQVLQELNSQPEADSTVAWPLALAPGAVIGRFQLLREIGKGGFGVVYEAKDSELGRFVAFKAVRPGPRHEIRAERLIREAETAARLSHPNIVTLFDVGRASEGPYLVMELLRGCTLSQKLRQEQPALRDALRIAVEVAQGLSHAHVHGVIHRDLTPGNVFLCDDGQVKLLDLGLAHAFGHRKIDGGTPTYMAPEQQRGAPEDERTDVFALGVMLFQMLTGEVPFVAGGPAEPATAPLLDVPEMPALADLVAQMLSIDPVRRPRDAGEALGSLAELLHELDRAHPAAPRPKAPSARRAVKRSSGERAERTWVCSVVTVEILRYFEQSVELQAQWKQRFNGYLARSTEQVGEADRVILDSGGGVAICFLGDPDGAMSCALGLLRSLVREEPQNPDPMKVRIGIHLGAVKLVKDINGNLNALGDGLHVAQQMMGFAGENQILTSRSFHDVASCLSDGYRPLFTLAGTRRDEQMREHAVYELRLPRPISGESHEARTADVIETGPARSQPLDPATGAAIEKRAAGILGPIAHHLVRTIGSRASTVRELGEALAAFMPVSGDRDAFLKSCSGETGAAPISGPTISGPTTALAPDVLERAGRQLAEYLGPMAKILVARTSARARSEEELYDLLAAEIESAKDRAAFRRKGPSAHQLR